MKAAVVVVFLIGLTHQCVGAKIGSKCALGKDCEKEENYPYDRTEYQNQCLEASKASVTNFYNRKTVDQLSHRISCHRCKNYSGNDTLFSFIEEIHGKTTPFGNVLDAGTGKTSLKWLLSMKNKVEKITAVTGSEKTREWLLDRRESGIKLRANDRLLVGNYAPTENSESDDVQQLLRSGEKFDVILVDYVLGAMDGFSPFYQEHLYPILSNLLKENGLMYIVGQEPYKMPIDVGNFAPSDFMETNTGEFESFDTTLPFEVLRLRDSCLMMGGKRYYREYPSEMVEDLVKASGLEVTHTKLFPINWGLDALRGQLRICESLDFVHSVHRNWNELYWHNHGHSHTQIHKTLRSNGLRLIDRIVSIVEKIVEGVFGIGNPVVHSHHHMEETDEEILAREAQEEAVNELVYVGTSLGLYAKYLHERLDSASDQIQKYGTCFLMDHVIAARKSSLSKN